MFGDLNSFGVPYDFQKHFVWRPKESFWFSKGAEDTLTPAVSQDDIDRILNYKKIENIKNNKNETSDPLDHYKFLITQFQELLTEDSQKKVLENTEKKLKDQIDTSLIIEFKHLPNHFESNT